MTKHNREFFTCDLCGVEMDKPHNGGEMGTYSLNASSEYAVAGDNLKLQDLCKQCNSYLGRLINDLKNNVREQRKAQKAND